MRVNITIREKAISEKVWERQFSTDCSKGMYYQSESENRSVMSYSLWPHGLYSPWNSPGQHTEVAFPSSRGSSQPRDRTQVSPLQVDSFPTELCGKRRKMLHGAIAIICQSDALKVKNSLENPISSCQVGSCSKLCLLNHLGNWQNFSLLPKVFSIM